MSLNEKIIAVSEDINQLLSKDIPIDSQNFMKLAVNVMNISDLAKHLK